MSQPTVTREQKQASRDAKVAHYDSIRRRYHRRAEQTLASLREALETAERRITSTDALDRRLLGDSANTIAREAADLVESAAAWAALDEVSYFAEPVLPDLSAYEVNHKDGDPANNDPSNLELREQS